MSLEDAVALARRLGAPRYTQGPGGNISVKGIERLFIKASGTRMRDASLNSGIATVRRETLEAAVAGDAVAEAAVFASTPRPSLEAMMHAIPHRVVAHTHPVAFCGWMSTRRTVPHRMHGAPVLELPPLLPGRELGRAIVATVAAVNDRGPLVLALRGHGLVVAAASVDDAVDLTKQIERRATRELPGLSAFEQELTALSAAPVTTSSDGLSFRTVPPTSQPLGRVILGDVALFAREVEWSGPLPADLGANPSPSGVLVDAETRVRTIWGRTPASLASATELVAAQDLLFRVLGDEAVPIEAPSQHALQALPAEQYRQVHVGSARA